MADNAQTCHNFKEASQQGRRERAKKGLSRTRSETNEIDGNKRNLKSTGFTERGKKCLAPRHNMQKFSNKDQCMTKHTASTVFKFAFKPYKIIPIASASNTCTICGVFCFVLFGSPTNVCADPNGPKF